MKDTGCSIGPISGGCFTAVVAPNGTLLGEPLRSGEGVVVADLDVTDIFLSRNTHPSSSAGVPGINLPMGLNSEGLPLGLELDGPAGSDRDLLVLARAVERVIGPLPAPGGF